MLNGFKVKSLFKKADSFFKDEQYDDALEYYNNILELDDSNLKALYKKAVVFLELKEYSESISILKSMLDIEKSEDVLLLLARIYVTKGEYNIASDYYKKALDDDIFDFDRFTNELIFFSMNLAFSENDDDINQFIHICNLFFEKYDSMQIRLDKSYALFSLGKFEDSLQNLDYILAQNPEYYSALELKSLVLRYLEEYEEVIKVVDEVLVLNPDEILSYYNKAYSLYKLGRLEDAKDCCYEAIHLEDNPFEVYLLLSKIFNKENSYDLALENINIALDLEKVNESIMNEQSYLISSKNSNKLYRFKSLILSNLNRFDEAHEICDNLIQRESEDVKNYYLKAKILFIEKNLDASLDYINKTLELDPGCSEAVKLKNQIESDY